MKYDLQAKIEPVKKLKGVINVTATTPESGSIAVGHLLPNIIGVKSMVGNLECPTTTETGGEV